MSAACALIKMPAECSRTTPRNRQQHFDMPPTDPLAVSLERRQLQQDLGGKQLHSFGLSRFAL
jgi:hypothetical protein